MVDFGKGGVMVKIWSVEGNSQLLDGGAMFGNAPRALWQKWMPPDAQGRVALSCRAMLVRSGSTNILCETGIGAYMEPKLAQRFGVQSSEHHLLDNLKKVGLENGHEDIDFVVLSHLHFDHAGGLLPAYQADSENRDLELLFPNARYVVSQEAFDRANEPHPRDRASFIPGLCAALMKSGRLDLIPKDQTQCQLGEINVGFFYSDGHTPGQMLTVVRHQGSGVVFMGDLAPGQAWIHLPITMGYDRFPELLIDEKKALYDLMVKDGLKAFFTHDPRHAAASLTFQKGRYGTTDLVGQLVDSAL